MSGPLQGVRFAVVDVETSGLSHSEHHVLQVGVVTVDSDGNVLDRWSSLVRPRNRWFFRVGPTHVHGIRRRDVRKAPPAEQVMHQLAGRLEGARFVAHNAPFDLGFVRKAADQAGVDLPIEQPLCTLRLSRALDPERTMSHKLTDVCERYGVSLDRPHDALADAEATAAILPHLLRAHGVQTEDQLAALPAPR
ncbi:MAG: 3'-5' exonuclease [Acidobacteria bacterium]|nr:3'-5' exonuclease [Acidobacteriota bacterium]